MNSCRYCGEKALDTDLYCPNRSARFPDVAAASASPLKPAHGLRSIPIVIAAIVLCAMVLETAVYLTVPKSSTSTFTGTTVNSSSASVLSSYGGIGGFAVRGSRTAGFTASFYLVNTRGTIEPFTGSAVFRITDGGAHTLYKSSFQMTISQYNVVNQSSGFLGPPSSGPGYLWRIPAPEVDPTVAKGNGANVGFAYLYFEASGVNASAETGGFSL